MWWQCSFNPSLCLRLTFSYFRLWHWTAPVWFYRSVTFLWCFTDDWQEEEMWEKKAKNVKKDMLSALRWWKAYTVTLNKNPGARLTQPIWMHWNLKRFSVPICAVQPDAAEKIFLSLPGESRQSGLLLGCSKERQPPPAIHYLKCVCCRQRACCIQMHNGTECKLFKWEDLTGHC